MRKYKWFESNKENNRKRGVVEVVIREWGSICVMVETSNLGGFIMGSELRPEEAREMAQALLDAADQAEKDVIEHGHL